MMRPSSLILLGCLGCAASPPAAPPTSGRPAVAIPAGCEQDLAGPWRLSADPSWTYHASDDGGTVVLAVGRHWADGGTPAGTSSAQVVLRRTTGGFVGETRAPRTGPGGPSCEASLPVEVAGCPDGGLLLRTVDRLRVDQRCAPVDAAPSERRVHLLVRERGDGGAGVPAD
jgi:hypothetical protein